MLIIKTNQEHLKGMSYEELLKEDERLSADPNTTMYEQLYLDILIGEKERELGYTYSLEEVFNELVDKEYIEYLENKNSKKGKKRFKIN